MLPSEFLKEQEKVNNIAKISNSLIEAFVKKNNIGALKLLFYISKSNLNYDYEKELQTFKIDTKKLIEFCNMDIKTLRRNIIQMQETVLTFISYNSEGSARYEENITVIPYSKILYGGYIEIKIFTKILSLIADVKNKFTFIDIENLMKLKSKHSIRMIQLLEMIEGFSPNVAKRKTYSLKELNLMFGTNYKNMYEFDRKILVPVKNELDENSSLTFIYNFTFDKDDITAPGRPKAVSVTIDLLSNRTRQLKLNF